MTHGARFISSPNPSYAMRETTGRNIEVNALKWLGGRDSNPDTQIQSLQSYR